MCVRVSLVKIFILFKSVHNDDPTWLWVVVLYRKWVFYNRELNRSCTGRLCLFFYARFGSWVERRWVFNGKSFINVMFRCSDIDHMCAQCTQRDGLNNENKMDTNRIVYYVWMNDFYRNLMWLIKTTWPLFFFLSRLAVFKFSPVEFHLSKSISLLFLFIFYSSRSENKLCFRHLKWHTTQFIKKKCKVKSNRERKYCNNT